MNNFSRIAPLLSSGDRPQPVPNPAVLQILSKLSRRGSADLPTDPGGIEPPILTEGPGDGPGDPRVGPMPWNEGTQPGLTIPGNSPRYGGVLPPGYRVFPEDPGAASATVLGGGPDAGDGQQFGSVRVAGGYGPPDRNAVFFDRSGQSRPVTPSLYDTTWSWDSQLGWVPQAQANDPTSRSFASNQSGMGFGSSHINKPASGHRAGYWVF